MLESCGHESVVKERDQGKRTLDEAKLLGGDSFVLETRVRSNRMTRHRRWAQDATKLLENLGAEHVLICLERLLREGLAWIGVVGWSLGFDMRRLLVTTRAGMENDTCVEAREPPTRFDRWKGYITPSGTCMPPA